MYDMMRWHIKMKMTTVNAVFIAPKIMN